MIANNILPDPFDWIHIPAGSVTLIPDDYDQQHSYLKGDQEISVPAFAIAKYPLTNAQFATFIDAGGYHQRQWWTNAGWEAREKGLVWDNSKDQWQPTGKAWVEPLYWRDATWNNANQPVVGVSWYESIAFCRWLSEVTGERIALPTEQQWQRAAQGDDHRTYPWGNDWDCTRCNNSFRPCDSDGTTHVTQYEGRNKGDSAFGVVDMAGNICEWCLTDYEQGTHDVNANANTRVLRGGSWNHITRASFRCDYRFRLDSSHRYYLFGFRCVLSV